MSESTEAGGPNEEQIRYWNDAAGAKWVNMQRLLDAQLAGFGNEAMEAAALAAGESVLDIGCGCGTTTFALARAVGNTGRATGADISAPMLEVAQAVVRKQHIQNVTFINADAQTYGFDPGSFDAAFSRFGVMFFSDPVAAFANLARALRPEGRLAFACWQPAADNPWMVVPTVAAMEHLEIEVPTDPNAPGPFSFGDAERVESTLVAAGFSEVSVEAYEPVLTIAGGGSLDDAVEFIVQLGPAAAPFRETDDATRSKVLAAVRNALAPYETSEGVTLASAAWVVRARSG